MAPTQAASSHLAREVEDIGFAFVRDVRAARLQRSLSLIAGLSSGMSGLEVAYQHYRGSYSQRVMYTPVILSQALLIAGVWGSVQPRAARTVLPLVAGITLADCALGFGLHLRGIHRKPGGWRLPVTNVSMGPPPLAPLLFGMSAYMGIVASRMRPETKPRRQAVALPAPPPDAPRLVAREARMQKHLALITALSAICSGVEALYSHYKNNFKYKAQWTPVAIAPLLAGAGFAALAPPPVASSRLARIVLPAASALAIADGAAGVFYHARGIVRRPGGAQHLVYNVMYGPPILAPLLFAACGFLGLLASFMSRHPGDARSGSGRPRPAGPPQQAPLHAGVGPTGASRIGRLSRRRES